MILKLGLPGLKLPLSERALPISQGDTLRQGMKTQMGPPTLQLVGSPVWLKKNGI